MSKLEEFSALMNDVSGYQQELAAFYEKMTHPDEKALMGRLMEQLENARQEAEKVVPQTIQQIQDSAQRSAAEAEKQLADLAQREKTLQAKSDGAKPNDVKLPPAAPKKEIRVDPKLGPALRLELLQRFGKPESESAQTESIREAWEDWQ